MKRIKWQKILILVSVLAWLSGCAEDSESGSTVPMAPYSGDMDAGFNDNSARAGGSVDPMATPTTMPVDSVGEGAFQPLPPEVERKVDFKQPQAGERFIFAANPNHNSIAVIDAQENSVQKVEPSKEQPLYLQALTVDGDDIAVVLNVGRHSSAETYATVIRQKVEGSNSPRHKNVKVVRGSNAIAISPSGRYAVIYFDPDYESANNITGSYHDITVIALTEGEERSINMTVGFRPSAVHFSESGDKGFVVTEDGVSILDFGEIEKQGSHIADTVALGYNLNQIPSDVSVTPDGLYALARLENASEVHLVDLESREVQALDLVSGEKVTEEQTATDDAGVLDDAGAGQSRSYAVTDLDLGPEVEGEGAFALAVIRDKHLVTKIPIPDAFEDPSKLESAELPEVVVGLAEISPNGERALLYTTALEDERITVLDLTDMDEEAQSYQLHKSIDTVIIAPDSENAMIIHKKQEGNKDEVGIDPDVKIDRSYGFSLFRLDDGFVKLETTETQPKTFVSTPASQIFILFRNDAQGIKEVLRISLENYLIDPILLSRPPISIGVVPKSERVFVNQEQSDGLITLIDWETNETEKVEGFDRASSVTEQRGDVSE